MPRHCSPALLAFAGAERARASVLAWDAEAAGGDSDSRSGLGRVLCVPASGATVKRSTSRWSVAAGSLKRSTRAECVRPSRHGMAQRCAVGRRGYLTVLHETTTGPILALRVGGCGSRAGTRRAAAPCVRRESPFAARGSRRAPSVVVPCALWVSRRVRCAARVRVRQVNCALSPLSWAPRCRGVRNGSVMESGVLSTRSTGYLDLAVFYRGERCPRAVES